MLQRLVFDTSDAASIAASANVGAYLRASDGTLITHTGGALDVNFTAVNLDIRDLSAAQDNVAISDGTDTLAVNGDGSINVVATATNLDIRNLSQATDSVAIGDGTDTVAVNADGSLNITDNGGSITVDATALDIRAISQATDSIDSWTHDGTGTAITSTAGALDVNIASGDIDDSLANTDIAVGSTSVDTTAGGTDLRATDLAARKWFYIYNNGNKFIYLGESGVTSATGFPLPPGAMVDLRAGASINMYAIADAGTQDVRTLELS